MTLTPNERRVISELARDLRRDYGATDVRLFGSAARGEMDEGSDIDIFVVVPTLDWPKEQAISGRCYEATLACGRCVAPSIFTAHELTDTPLRVSPFVESVQRDGVSV